MGGTTWFDWLKKVRDDILVEKQEEFLIGYKQPLMPVATSEGMTTFDWMHNVSCDIVACFGIKKAKENERM